MKHRPSSSAAGFLSLLVLAAGGGTPDALAAQEQARLQGVVGDAHTMQLIGGATITLLDLDAETRTGADGTFAFADAPLGPVTIRVDAEGYPSVTEEVEVNSDAIQFVQVFLPSLDAILGEILVTGEADRGVGSSRTAADLLAREVSGARQRSGSIGETDYTILLRGVSSFSGSGEPYVYLDGIRLSSLSHALDILSQIPAEDVEDIQVLRGATSAFLEGGFAADGVIHITTKSGGEG